MKLVVLSVFAALASLPVSASETASNKPTQVQFIQTYVMAYKLDKSCDAVDLNEPLIEQRAVEYRIDLVSAQALEILGLAAEWADLVIEKENFCSSITDMNGQYLLGDGPFPQGFLTLK